MPAWIRWLVTGLLVLALLLCMLGFLGGRGAALAAPKINPISSPVALGPLALSGTGTPNTSLGVYLGGQDVGRAQVGSDGNWTYNLAVNNPGAQNLELRPLGADGMSRSELTTALDFSAAPKFEITYPTEAEELDAQDFLMQGAGNPGELVTITRNGQNLGTTRVGANGSWAYVVSKPNAGDYEFGVQQGSSGAIVKRKISVKTGLSKASNARCPCALQISTLEKQKLVGGTVILSKDGKEVSRQAAPALFTGLDEGNYTYQIVVLNGYQDFTTGKASLPRNKSIPVYMTPIKR
jgi:hypothetical protein